MGNDPFFPTQNHNFRLVALISVFVEPVCTPVSIITIFLKSKGRKIYMTSAKQQAKSPPPPLIIAGQFPPPVNGFAYITQEIAKVFAANYEATIIDLAPHVPNNGVTYHFRRLFLTLRGLLPMLRGGFGKDRPFYIACEGRLGLVYTIMLCAVARVLGFPIYIHHHNFNYIDESSALMACLLRVLGKRATHIFLCHGMAQGFTDRYRRSIKSLVLSNSAFVDDVLLVSRPWQEGKPLVIGLLSNLNEEKGLSHFLSVLRGSISEGLNIKGVLAGPPVSDSDRELIAAAKQELGDRLDYRGSVYGEAKSAFFSSIDVFVFPTRYANEAQPTVVFEAMAHGVPILSYDRGCIRGQVGVCGAVLARDAEFAPFALDWLKAQMASPNTLSQLKHDAKVAFSDDHTKAKHNAERLLDLVPFVAQPSKRVINK